MECMHEPDTGILCFRIVPEGLPAERLDLLQHHVYNTILSDGRRSISITDLGDTATLRLVVLSPTVSVESVKETIAVVRRNTEGFS